MPKVSKHYPSTRLSTSAPKSELAASAILPKSPLSNSLESLFAILDSDPSDATETQLSTSAPNREYPVSPVKLGSSPKTSELRKLLGIVDTHHDIDDESLASESDESCSFGYLGGFDFQMSPTKESTPNEQATVEFSSARRSLFK